jgi:hypothetical protein
MLGVEPDHRRKIQMLVFQESGVVPASAAKAFATGDASAMQSMRGTLFDRRVHGDDRCARNRRPVTGCLNGKSIASLISSLRRVFEGGYVELFQLAVCRLLRNVRATHRAADPDWKSATSPGREVNVTG